MPYDRVLLRLSIQRALLGAVTSNLRMVTAEGDDEEIRLYFYYHGEISEEVNELAEVAATEVISDFPKQMLDLKILRLDAPAKMPTLAEVVYRRYEEKL